MVLIYSIETLDELESFKSKFNHVILRFGAPWCSSCDKSKQPINAETATVAVFLSRSSKAWPAREARQLKRTQSVHQKSCARCALPYRSTTANRTSQGCDSRQPAPRQ